MDAALGMRVQHRTARRRQVVRVHRHPRRLRVMGGDCLSEGDLDRQVVSHQRGSHLGQRQQVLSRGEHRDRAVPGVRMQVGKQQCLAAPQPPAADDLLGEPRGDDLNAVGTERATGHGSHHPLGHVVRRGREQVQRRQQPAPLTGQRIPSLLHPQRHRPEISGRVQDLHRHRSTDELHYGPRRPATSRVTPTRRCSCGRDGATGLIGRGSSRSRWRVRRHRSPRLRPGRRTAARCGGQHCGEHDDAEQDRELGPVDDPCRVAVGGRHMSSVVNTAWRRP